MGGGDSDLGPGEVRRLGDPEPAGAAPGRGQPAGDGPRLLPELAGAAGRGQRRECGRRAAGAMEALPGGGGRTGRPEPEARPEDVAEEAVPEAAGAPSLSGAPLAGRPPGSRDSWEGEEDSEPGDPRGGRTSRTASLVSGLLTELYSCTEEDEAAGGGRWPGGRRQRRDSLDSSTEASGSDAVLGGRGGAGDSRVLQELQELQERPSQRHQRQYLRQKGERRLGGGPPPGRPALQRPPERTRAEQPSAQILSLGHLLCSVAGARPQGHSFMARLSSCCPLPTPSRVAEWSISSWMVAAGLHPPPQVFVEAQGRGSPGSHFARTAVRTGLEFLISISEVT